MASGMKVWTTGPSGKSLNHIFKVYFDIYVKNELGGSKSGSRKISYCCHLLRDDGGMDQSGGRQG